MSAPRLTTCAICSSTRLKTVRNGRYTTHAPGRDVIVSNVDYLQCLACGEKYFDDMTMARIEHARNRPGRKRAV